MATKETILTAEGLRKLEDELNNLRTVRRQEVAERLKVAISYGDISENSEYDDAKSEQAFIEGRILELEQMINTATIIDDTANKKKGVVGLGSVVVVKDMEWDVLSYESITRLVHRHGNAGHTYFSYSASCGYEYRVDWIKSAIAVR